MPRRFWLKPAFSSRRVATSRFWPHQLVPKKALRSSGIACPCSVAQSPICCRTVVSYGWYVSPSPMSSSKFVSHSSACWWNRGIRAAVAGMGSTVTRVTPPM